MLLPVLRSFEYEGQHYDRGDMIEVPPIDAAILGRQQKVSLTVGARPTLEAAAKGGKKKPPTKKPNAYKRRDLQAE